MNINHQQKVTINKTKNQNYEKKMTKQLIKKDKKKNREKKP